MGKTDERGVFNTQLEVDHDRAPANPLPPAEGQGRFRQGISRGTSTARRGTVQRSGGSSRLRQLWAWRGDWIEHTTEPGAEHAVVDRAADLKKQIGASPRPSHLLRFIHSPVDQEIRGTFGN